MNKLGFFGAASALSLILATPVLAQGELLGVNALDDQIEDLERDVARDMNRGNDSYRFGAPDARPGFTGSASVGYNGKTGNNESQDLAIGLRLRYGEGQFEQIIGVMLDYEESDKRSTKEDVFGIYDGMYYFDDKFYAFILGRVQMDGLADQLSDEEIAKGVVLADKVKRDGFVGIGPGYRIYNTPDMAWRMQIGVGVSYIQYGDSSSKTEEAGILSSRFYYKVNDNVFLTNDTDFLYADAAKRANNDFGINFQLSDRLSTRVSYLVDYNEARDIRSDNKLGVSLVLGF